MIEKDLKEIYPVDIMSQSSSWEQLSECLKDIKEDIQINFGGIDVISPWSYEPFIKIIKQPNIHLKFINRTDLVGKIKAVAVLNGGNPDRIINENVEKPKQKTAAEIKIEKNGELLVEKFKLSEEDGCKQYVFDAYKEYSQIQVSTTVQFIAKAIELLVESTGIMEYYIDLDKLVISSAAMSSFADMIVKFETHGIVVKLNINDEDSVKLFRLSLHKASTGVYTISERFNTIHEHIKEGTVGILIKYKKSRALDEFGRYGKGEIISSQIAIYRGLVFINNTYHFKVDVYSSSRFYTKIHWISENDGESHPGLMKDELEIPLDEIGFMSYYLGSKYHFIEPIQQDKSETVSVIYDTTDEGMNISKKCTIPERMQVVFDDWGIEYDKEKLHEYIERTAKELEKKEK